MKHRGPTLRNIEGAITLPLALMFGCALFATFGAWSILRQERKSEVLELGALNCIGYRAQLFRNLQNEIEGTNSAIQITRAAIAASSLLPAALPELVAALNATVSLQETSLAAYQVQSAAWPWQGPAGAYLCTPPAALLGMRPGDARPRIRLASNPSNPLTPRERSMISACIPAQDASKEAPLRTSFLTHNRIAGPPTGEVPHEVGPSSRAGQSLIEALIWLPLFALLWVSISAAFRHERQVLWQQRAAHSILEVRKSRP
jgi:hypothetical protein